MKKLPILEAWAYEQDQAKIKALRDKQKEDSQAMLQFTLDLVDERVRNAVELPSIDK